MSGKIPGKKNGEVTPGYSRPAKPLEITVAIRNKETQQWETSPLGEGDTQVLHRAIEAIKQAGAQAGLGVWDVFTADGTELEIKGEGVFVKEGQAWKDLLSDQTVSGSLRGYVRKTLKAVTSVLGHGKEEEIVIHVRVTSPATLRLAEVVQDEVQGALDKEEAFHQKVLGARTALNDEGFTADLVQQGWTRQEIEGYKDKLMDLVAQSKRWIALFDTAMQVIRSGNIQSAMSELCVKMRERYPAYVLACQQLIIPQKVAKGRTLTQPKEAFSIDLTHVISHTKLAKTLFSEMSQVGGIDGGEWKMTLESMRVQKKALQEELAFSPMVASLNYNHQLNQEFAGRLEVFVQAYQEHRGLFQKIMLEHGLGELESAFVFNHYVTLHAVLKQWNSRLQKVVDLGNRKEYAAALQAYTDVMGDLFFQLMIIVAHVFFTLKRFKEPSVQTAIKEFASNVGIPNPPQLPADLSTERAAIKQQLMFAECVEKAQKGKIPVPTEALQILDTIKERLSAEDIAMPQLTRLFDRSLRFIQMFTYKGLMHPSNPLYSAWKAILKERGWPLKDIQRFTDLTNAYAEIIEPLQQAQQAIATETDPSQKSVLQVAYKALAEKLQPELNACHKAFQKLGGMDKFRSVVEAVQELALLPENLTPRRQIIMQELQTEATSIVQLMEDKLAFLNQVYDDLGLSPSQ